ncbi:MAG: YihY/virulence factor BrkB family protein, partial [Actinomycetota bacterium]|nr:YihY/virulence factor BrkB family protein [Actinomycetota bacterium]
LMTVAMTTIVAALEGILRRLSIDPSSFDGMWTSFVTLILPIVISFVFFFLLYRLGPRRWVTTGAALQGAVLATVLWELAKAGFAYYVRNVARVQGLYGTLEGLIVLALWLELSVSIILYCGEVVALLGGVKPPAGAAKA